MPHTILQYIRVDAIFIKLSSLILITVFIYFIQSGLLIILDSSISFDVTTGQHMIFNGLDFVQWKLSST